MIVSNSRGAGIATLLVCATFPLAASAQNGPSSIGDLPDLDASVGFGTPRQVTILHAYDRTKDKFYIFPSAVDFVMPHDQASTVGLQIARRRGTDAHGSFTFTVRPRFQSSEINKAVAELKGRYPKALFAFPVPSKARLSMSTIEQPSIVFSPVEESSPLSNDIAFTAKLTPIESRFLQLPQSLDSPSATFQFAYSIRGVSREGDGRAAVVERGYRLGGILNGFCAPFPNSTVEVSSGRTGCAYVSFNKALVKEIQGLLQRSKHYEGRVDGVFGPLTDTAIRSFQRSHKLFVSGYPTRELVEQIKAAMSAPPTREKQVFFLREQLKIARDFELPVLCHVRKSQGQMLKHARQVGPSGGIAPAFNGSFQQAQAYIDAGFKLGFAGNLTFTRTLQIRRLASELPLSSIVVETDAPDIAPAWLHLSVNTPSEAAAIGAALAALRGETPDHVAKATTRNALEVMSRLRALMAA